VGVAFAVAGLILRARPSDHQWQFASSRAMPSSRSPAPRQNAPGAALPPAIELRRNLRLANSPSPSSAPGVDNDSMRATTLVYNATTALKKACPRLQLAQAPQR
jgi:hypothetical protein